MPISPVWAFTTADSFQPLPEAGKLPKCTSDADTVNTFGSYFSANTASINPRLPCGVAVSKCSGTTTAVPGVATKFVGRLKVGSGPVGVIVKPVGIGGIRVCCEPDVDWLINVTSPESTVVLKPRSPTITGSANRYAAKPPNTPLKMLLSSVLLTREISEPSPELTLPSPPAS